MPQFRTAARTDLGLVRTNNEDAFLLLDLPPRQQLWLVADGVAGREAGEVASATCVAVFERLARAGKLAAALDADVAEPLLAMAVHKAHVEVSRLAVESGQQLGMSTTLTVALVSDQRVDVAHVGDSRLYHWQAGQLRQITADQTVAQQWVDDGRLSPDQLAEHPDRNTLLQSIGLEADDHPLTPAHYRFTVEPGDRVLLCSDGLSDLVGNDTIAALLAATADLNSAVDELIKAALDAGGRDNVTVIAAELARPSTADQ